jgi:hypothetical protein
MHLALECQHRSDNSFRGCKPKPSKFSKLSEFGCLPDVAAWPGPSVRPEAIEAAGVELDVGHGVLDVPVPEVGNCSPPFSWAAPKILVDYAPVSDSSAMSRMHDAADLDAWLTAARRSELASFATGISRDVAAVRAGIVEPWSTSPVEGQINRVKTIKRQMYGRARHDLLRKRVLAAA